MKFLKKFNEELNPETYRNAANLRDAQGDQYKTADELRKHADKIESNEHPRKYLLYYAFDWDDNLLHMTTPIHMENLVDGEWIPKDVSTSDFTIVRNDKENWRITNPDYAFSDFRDFGKRGNKAFLEDVIESINSKKFAPAWGDFKECLINGSLFAIITARGHESESMRMGIEWIIDNHLTEDEIYEMYNNLLKFAYIFKHGEEFDRILRGKPSNNPLIKTYLDNCHLIGVSAPSRGGNPSNPEKAKEDALMEFKTKINDFAESIGWYAKVGFSDDDPKNVKHIENLVDNIHHEKFPQIKEIVVKGTGEDKTKKIRKFENFSPTTLSNLPNAAMSGGMNMRDPYHTSNLIKNKIIRKISNDIFGEYEDKVDKNRKIKKIR